MRLAACQGVRPDEDTAAREEVSVHGQDRAPQERGNRGENRSIRFVFSTAPVAVPVALRGPERRGRIGRIISLFVDLTTAFEEAGRHAHGTTRVERGLVAALAEMAVPQMAFCRYDRLLDRFVGMTPGQAWRIATRRATDEVGRTAPRPWRSHPFLAARRRLERWVRGRARPRLRRLRAELMRGWMRSSSSFPSGSILLLPGELQRQSFARLMALRRERAVRLAFVFYDLLGVLPAGDRRLTDPLSADLPSTDFMVREGSLILAISRFSAGVLAGHLRDRAMARPTAPPLAPSLPVPPVPPLPPIDVIRLGSDLTPGRPGAVPVPGLEPGTFVVTVGDVVERKNHALLVTVWRQLIAAGPPEVPHLVVAGRIGLEEVSLVQRVQQDPSLRARIRFMPNVSDETLAWLYANCRFTLFPSRREGFGLPVAESLAFGKLCVASSAEAIPEAGQDLAIHLDPGDEPGWRSTIARLLADPRELADREAQIRQRFRRSTWRDTAADVLAAVRAHLTTAMETAPR